MAILPSKNSGNAKQHASGARFRQRKISVKQPLTIYSQKDLPTLDINNELEPSQINHLNVNGGGPQQSDLHAVETGVDKNEEDEIHLQQVINAAQKALLGSKREEKQKDKKSANDSKSNDSKAEANAVYIPTPDASKVWADAPKYYNDHTFKEPKSYIAFSATIEDTIGVEFNMDEIDETFVNEVLNVNYPKLSKKLKNENESENSRKCSDLEFEMVCEKFEKTIEEKQPFLSMDATNILTYDEISAYILEDLKSPANSNIPNSKYLSSSALKEKLAKEIQTDEFVTLYDKHAYSASPEPKPRHISKLLQLFGEPIYNHWKQRKIDRKGKSIHPGLKFEDPSANEKDNDNDPYICFRRREFRQARKTRRADTVGAERIRQLQKSMRKARDLIMCITQRELIKTQDWKTEEAIFKLRVEGKNLKRAVGVKGDDHLFYPHKRKKIIKIKDEDDEKDTIKARRMDKRKLDRDGLPGTATIGTNAVHKDKLLQQQQQLQQLQQDESTSSTQPYVKLPPSKIPDMDLVTVSFVLKEKNETIKRAVLEKLRKRKEQDKGFVNAIDDPYQPYFDISTNKNCAELSHIPYSSIAAAHLHQINTTNYISESLKKLLEEGKKPLPGMKTFRGSNGELIPSKPFPHLQTLLEDKYKDNRINSASYISQLFSNIKTHNFSAYNNGYGYQQQRQQHSNEIEEESKISEPIFRLRKRAGRNNRTFIDRRGLIDRPNDVIDEFLNFNDNEDDNDKPKENEAISEKVNKIANVYDSRADTIKRLDSNWRFDNDLSESQKGAQDPFSLDPSRLNSISDDTQSIRFGSMLLSKSYGLLRESVHQRQQVFIQQAKMRALQQQQLANKQQQQQHQQLHTQPSMANQASSQ